MKNEEFFKKCSLSSICQIKCLICRILCLHIDCYKEKNRKEPFFDVCSSCRALVISGMDLALRASSYAYSMPLIAITTVITNNEKQKQRLEKPKK